MISSNIFLYLRQLVWCGKPLPLDPRNQTTKTTRTTAGNGTSNADLL